MVKEAVFYPRALHVPGDRCCDQAVFFPHIAILVDRMKQAGHPDHQLLNDWLERSRLTAEEADKVQTTIWTYDSVHPPQG